MKRKGLYFLIALALGGVGAVHAQDAMAPMDSSATDTSAANYDGRWYIAPTVGGYYNDTDRHTNSRQIYYGLGMGRFISPNASIDVFFDRTVRDRDGGGAWGSNTLGVAGRWYAGGWNAWRPYLLAGVMASQHRVGGTDDFSPAAELGVGVSKTVTDSSDIRIEAGYRYDFDNDTAQDGNNGFGDYFLGFSFLTRFGEVAAAPAPAPVVAPPPPPPDCSTLDTDGDNVNDCTDQCPATVAGTIVGPDGCAQKVVIDLRGVNFKFDRPSKGTMDLSKSLAEPTDESLSILNQAVDTLQRYPQVTVTVAGYTDAIGSETYNQGLSERRAKIVYDYLTSHGIDASRLQGPIGYGESHPIATNETEAGRAQNRRTELQVEQ